MENENMEINEQEGQEQQQHVHPHIPDYAEILKAQKISFEDIKEHMTGPVISIVAHIIIISMLLSMVVTSSPPERQEIEVKMQEVEIKPLEKIPEPPKPQEVEVVETEIEIERPEVTTDVNVQVEDVAVSATTTDVVMPNVLSVKPSNSALILPGVMANRSGGARKAAIKKYGGSDRTELAVMKGLKWLRDHQNADGSWGEQKNFQPPFTAMALLAFLAHGETPSSEQFGACVLKAIKKLVEYAEDKNPINACQGNGYGHMIVTYALSEAYALTRIPMLENHMNKMIEYTVKGQNAVGGYNYNYNNANMRSDTSVIGWACQAMKAAFAAGSTVQGLEAAMEKAIQCLKSVQASTDGSNKGGFVYSTEGGKKIENYGGWQTTPIGTLCMQLLGAGADPKVKEAIDLMLKRQNWVNWEGKDPNAKDKKEDTSKLTWALYRWYYQTQVYFQGFQGAGKEWKEWNKMFTTELLKNQKSDGRWDTPLLDYERSPAGIAAAKKDDKKDDKKKQERGHGEMMFKDELDNPVYATSLCCLMLTVYYRYLPTFKVVEGKGGMPMAAAPAAPGGESDGEKKDEAAGLSIE